MTIDTRRKVISIQLRRVITMFAFIISVIAIILLGKLPKEFLGMTKYQWALVFAVVYILVIIVQALWEYQYIFFSDEKNFIVLRYFSLSYFNRVKKSVEIPVNEFEKFELSYTFFGLKPKLRLYRIIKGKQAVYPKVCLSILKQSQLDEIINTLQKYSKPNQ